MKKKSRSRSRKTKSRSGTTKHHKVRITCHKCGRSHSTASHRFHGVGSYARTH